jgi:hypothetical protein
MEDLIGYDCMPLSCISVTLDLSFPYCCGVVTLSFPYPKAFLSSLNSPTHPCLTKNTVASYALSLLYLPSWAMISPNF